LEKEIRNSISWHEKCPNKNKNSLLPGKRRKIILLHTYQEKKLQIKIKYFQRIKSLEYRFKIKIKRKKSL